MLNRLCWAGSCPRGDVLKLPSSRISTWNASTELHFPEKIFRRRDLSLRGEIQYHRGIQTESSFSHVRLTR